MSNFWTISLLWALFLVFIVVALAFVLPPLLRRNAKQGEVDRKEANVAIYHDQLAELKTDLDSGELDAAQYEDARREIERRLSEDVPLESAPVVAVQAGRWPAFVLAGAIPALAIAMYVGLGNPEALLGTRAEAPAGTMGQGQHDAAPMIAALEAKLQAKPDDVSGWYMLARSYAAIGQYDKSALAFAKASELLPDDSSLLADYADALAMAQGGNLQGKPLELIERALKLNPLDAKSLNLAGTAAYEIKNFAKAAEYWQRLLKILPPDSEDARGVASAVAEAERAAGGVPSLDNLSSFTASPVEEKSSQPLKNPAEGVSGTVSLSKELLGKVDPADTVFIFAQLPQGPKMPLASLRIEARQLPYHFTLDDSVAMSPSNKLSDHPEVMVSARVSKSGQAMARSGDLQGKIGPIKLGRKDVAITIDSVLP